MRPSPALKPTTSPPSPDATLQASDAGHPGNLSPVARAALLLLRGYKLLVSPLFTGACRFHPSCSTYMAEAIEMHGTWRGVWLGLRRLGRCHPLGSHGVDPVPPVAR